jgi:hypothetical protein
MSCGDGLLKRTFVGDMRPAASMRLDLESADAWRDRARRTWSGVRLRVLHWLSLRGGPEWE